MGLFAFALSSAAYASSAKTEAPIVVFGNTAAIEELSDTLTYPARVISKVNTTILAEVDGVVTKIPGDLGSRVRAKQALLQINHTDPIYKYAPVVVVSPINGVVSSIDVSEGAQVTKGQKLASVMDPGKLRIAIEVPADDLAVLKRGMTGELRIGSRAEPIEAKLSGLSPFVDPTVGTATAEFEVDTKKFELSPGLVGRITVKANVRKGIRIPEYALIYRDQAPFARIYDQGKVRFSSVKLGKKQEGKVEILSGVHEKDIVIERSSRFAGDGETVQLDSGKPGQPQS